MILYKYIHNQNLYKGVAMSKKSNNKNELSKEARDTIIDEAVKQYKEGKIKSSLDV